MPEQSQRVARDAKTGRFVTLAYARQHPDTTVVEKVKHSPPAPARRAGSSAAPGRCR